MSIAADIKLVNRCKDNNYHWMKKLSDKGKQILREVLKEHKMEHLLNAKIDLEKEIKRVDYSALINKYLKRNKPVKIENRDNEWVVTSRHGVSTIVIVYRIANMLSIRYKFVGWKDKIGLNDYETSELVKFDTNLADNFEKQLKRFTKKEDEWWKYLEQYTTNDFIKQIEGKYEITNQEEGSHGIEDDIYDFMFTLNDGDISYDFVIIYHPDFVSYEVSSGSQHHIGDKLFYESKETKNVLENANVVLNNLFRMSRIGEMGYLGEGKVRDYKGRNWDKYIDGIYRMKYKDEMNDKQIKKLSTATLKQNKEDIKKARTENELYDLFNSIYNSA